MAAGQWFWIIYVLSVLFGGWFIYSSWGLSAFGGSFILFVLVGLVGWKTFGPPLQ